MCIQIWSQIGQREGRAELDDKRNLPVDDDINGVVVLTCGITSEFIIPLWLYGV